MLIFLKNLKMTCKIEKLVQFQGQIRFLSFRMEGGKRLHHIHCSYKSSDSLENQIVFIIEHNYVDKIATLAMSL